LFQYPLVDRLGFWGSLSVIAHPLPRSFSILWWIDWGSGLEAAMQANPLLSFSILWWIDWGSGSLHPGE